MSVTAADKTTITPSTEELVRRLGEKTAALSRVHNDAICLQSDIAKIQQQLLSFTRREAQSVIGGHAVGSVVDPQQEEVELMTNPAITFAVKVAQKVYGGRFEGKSFPSAPSVEQVTHAFSREEQQKEIAGRTEPTLRFMVVEDGETLRYQPIILDGAREMPLETYEDRDACSMTREQRVFANRKLNENPDYRKELDHDDMTVYDLLSHGAAMQGKPIDQATWSMLTAKFKEGGRFVWYAVWEDDQSDRGKVRADYVGRNVRLRFAVWGDVIS